MYSVLEPAVGLKKVTLNLSSIDLDNGTSTGKGATFDDPVWLRMNKTQCVNFIAMITLQRIHVSATSVEYNYNDSHRNTKLLLTS